MSATDGRALAALSQVASLDAEPEGEVTEVECWAPSEHPIAEGGFRVICRVHFRQDAVDRYRDMICIGDMARDPVSDYCYQWAYYSDMPEFEDYPAFPAGSLRE